MTRSLTKSPGIRCLDQRPSGSLWAGFGGVCETKKAPGDPVVLYDKMANRWVITQFAGSPVPERPKLECIAVSTTSDVTPAHTIATTLIFAPSALNYYDYPKLGSGPTPITWQ